MCIFVSRKELVEIRQTSTFSPKKEMSEWYIDELTGTLEKANQEWLFIASHSIRALNKAGSRYKRNLLHTSSHSA